MSRTIDVSNPSDLSEAEALYAHARGMLNDDQMRELGYDPTRAVMTDPPPHATTNFGHANTVGLTAEDVDKAKASEEDLEPDEANLTEPQLQGYEPKEVVQFDDGDAVVDPTDSYSNWNNDQLREELVVRGLSARGNKAELVERLEADDRGDEEPEEV